MRLRMLRSVRWMVLAAMGSSAAAMALAQDKAAPESTPTATVRFDENVRENFFAGFDGDADKLKEGMKQCEAMLSENPKHAESMVWLGSGEVFLSGQKFSKGDVVGGMKYWQQGLDRMNKAAELEPDNIGVLIPRAAVLMPASRNLPGPIKQQVLKSVLADFNRVYETQKDMLDQLGEHPLGELRMGLADVHRSLGDLDQSREQLEAILKELPDTDYAKRAEAWLAAKPSAKLMHNCIGCHTK